MTTTRRSTLITLLAALLLAAACRPPAAAPGLLAPEPTPALAASIRGALTPAREGIPTSGRSLALCRLDPGAVTTPAPCTLLDPAVTSGEQGRFVFDDVEPGRYLIVLDSGLGDFRAAHQRWAGQQLNPVSWAWLRDSFLELGEEGAASTRLPDSLPADVVIDRARYAEQTLLIGESPFMIGHRLAGVGGVLEAEPLIVSVPPGEPVEVRLPVYAPAQPDLAAIRARSSPLTREELPLIDRDLSARWERFLAGDDSAYRDTDVLVIDALRGGSAHEIGSAYFSSLEAHQDRLIKAVGYITLDVQSGQKRLIGWLDPASGDVIEARTGYRLNVRDNPGVWIETGPEGEQFYRYGFTYYRQWDQILPDPILYLIGAFYTSGAAHLERYLEDYQAAAGAYGGDLRFVEWDAALAERMRTWQPVTAPFVRLPDSGTVDIRRERFMRAMIDRVVVVDDASVMAFINSEASLNGIFVQQPDPQEVRDALLLPYRSGHLFSDLEAAIILDATYGGSGPLTVRISDGLAQGFHVPRYTDNEMFVSQGEIANVLLGYPGALNSRWAHEMAHIVEFRSEQYTFSGRPPEGSRCEPLKYMMEYMWWVQRYPGDAPDWDWMPINSGLTLARLLAERFHNSGC